MPFKSLTDAEYEDIFKSAIGDCDEVENNYMGDICKSLTYKGTSKTKTVEDEVVTPNENEALTPGETAKHQGSTTLDTRTESVPCKPSKVKLFSAHEGISEKKIIPVFKSKPKIKSKGHLENSPTKKILQVAKEKSNSEQEHQNTKTGKKIRSNNTLDNHKTTSENKGIPQKAKEKDDSEQEHQKAKSGKKIRKDTALDHHKTTSENKDSDSTLFATPTEKVPATKVYKKSSEMTVRKGKKKVNDGIHSETSDSYPIKLGKKTLEMNATVRKCNKKANEDTAHSRTSSPATEKSSSQLKKTTNKPNTSSISKDMELSIEAEELSENGQSPNQSATPALSGEFRAKERQSKLSASSNSKVDSESSQLVPSQQEIPLSQPPAQLNLKQRLKWLQVRREVGVWVQCCNESCSKWRYLESTRDPQQVPRRWFCNMNPDKSLASCAVPQKGPSIIQELDLIENQYTAGSVVWARLAGYPWWPAMVDDDPDVEQYYWITTLSDIPTHYNVVFFDEKPPTRAWITPKNLRPFYGSESRREYKVTVHRGIDYSKRLAVAKAQASEALEMDFKHRLQKFSFLARFKGPFVMNTRSALSYTQASQSQEGFQDNDDMIQLLKEVKHRRKHSLAISNTESQKRPKISVNTVCKSVDQSRSETTINSSQTKKRRYHKIKETEKELGLSKLTNSTKQPSATDTHARHCDKEIMDTEDTSNKEEDDKEDEKEDEEELTSMEDTHHEKEQATDDDDQTVMSEDMFGEDDSTQFESDHQITNSESPLVKQNENQQEISVIKPENDHDTESSGKILTNLVTMVCTSDEKEFKSSVNMQEKDEPEQVTGESAQIPSSLQVIVGNGEVEETTSSAKVEPKYHNEQSSSLPSSPHSARRSGCQIEHSDGVRKGNSSQSLSNSAQASSCTGGIQDQSSSCVSNDTGICSVLNAGESILEVPLVEYPDDAVVPQGFSPSSRESSPDFEAEE